MAKNVLKELLREKFLYICNRETVEIDKIFGECRFLAENEQVVMAQGIEECCGPSSAASSL